MKRTFITNMPDESGAFLKASRIIAGAGANITRVSYNKSVDAHMLFLDVAGTPIQLDRVSEGLQEIGYTQSSYPNASVMLLEFQLRDVPGAVVPVLELIRQFDFNITYINSQETGGEFQFFKMGLLVENPRDVKDFLDRSMEICCVRIIEYDRSEKILDNTVFYMGFANQMSSQLGLSQEDTQELMVQSNRVMQLLDERNEPSYKTFEHIGKFGEFLHAHRSEAFKPRVSRYALRDDATLTCIEPACGSNMFIIEKDNDLLCIDTGFAYFKEEMLALLSALFPRFGSRVKEAIVTHPDIDHCGLLNLFDTIYATEESLQHFDYEQQGLPNFREQNPAHLPYSKISRILSGYEPPSPEKLSALVPCEPHEQRQPLVEIGSFDFRGYKLRVFRGNGGHAVGEAVFVDEGNRLVFSGDIVVNAEGFSNEQREFNSLAPYLMTSVNMDSAKATEEREFLLGMFGPRAYTYCCGHGALLGKKLDDKTDESDKALERIA